MCYVMFCNLKELFVYRNLSLLQKLMPTKRGRRQTEVEGRNKVHEAKAIFG